MMARKKNAIAEIHIKYQEKVSNPPPVGRLPYPVEIRIIITYILIAMIFLLMSLTSLVFLLGLIWGTRKEGRSGVGLLFLTIWAVLPGVLAFIPTDSADANGYPGSFQALYMITKLHGAIHIVLSFIAFTSGLLATLFISLRFSRDEHLR
jgi:ABC-type Na+ efflux pump permease subunit